MNPEEQAARLGTYLRSAREVAGLSLRELERTTGIGNTDILRLEQGFYAKPDADRLARLAAAVNLTLADVYARADYAVPTELPSFQPYLRTKYRDMPAPTVDELARYFRRLANKHGFSPEGPAPGEDEQPEAKASRPTTSSDRTHGSAATSKSAVRSSAASRSAARRTKTTKAAASTKRRKAATKRTRPTSHQDDQHGERSRSANIWRVIGE